MKNATIYTAITTTVFVTLATNSETQHSYKMTHAIQSVSSKHAAMTLWDVLLVVQINVIMRT